MNSLYRTRVTLVVMAVIAAISGCTPAATSSDSIDNKTKPVAVRVVSVAATEVQMTTVQPATVHPYYSAEIRSKVSGYVASINADIGDFMKAGQTLATLDVPELVMQRDVFSAGLDRARAEETQADANIELAAADVDAAKAKAEQTKSQTQSAEATLAGMQAEYDRTKDMVDRQSLQPRMLDEATMKRDSAKAELSAASSAITAAQADVTVAQAKQSAAKAALAAAKADTEVAAKQLAELDVMIDFATLKAPFDGVVTTRDIDLGDLVDNATSTIQGNPLFVLHQIDKVRVHVPVPESDAAMVSRGDAITLTFPSFVDDTIQAAVTRVTQSLDPQTRTMMVEAEIENPDGKLIPGMFGQATIKLGIQVAANMLPARSVRFDGQGNAFVYVVGKDETVEVVSIQTGIDDGRSIEVVGIDAGVRVVDANLTRLTGGQKVTLLGD